MSYLPLGLDIGSKTIKLIQLQKSGGKLFLQLAGLAPTPPKGMASDNKIDLESVSIVIKKLVAEINVTTRQVNASLPESQIITRVIEMPYLTERELTSAIKWEAEQYIPLPLNEVKMDVAILSSPKGNKNEKMQVLLVAAPLMLIEKYRNVLQMAGLEPVSLEPEITAVSRSLIASGISPTLVMNLGAATTDLMIFKSGAIVFTRSIASGGEALTRAIVREMGLEAMQAEEYKTTYGLDESKLEGKIMSSVKPIFETMTEEIKKSLAFYQNRYPEEPIKLISLCGGTTMLPGLMQYLTQRLGIETQIGNPWFNINVDLKNFPKIAEQGPVYSVACGLAMKEIS